MSWLPASKFLLAEGSFLPSERGEERLLISPLLPAGGGQRHLALPQRPILAPRRARPGAAAEPWLNPLDLTG